ncbi:hypothetical protein PVAP13_9KG207439 [Panicum virgatum]|uniref:Uncharacterized protein n=1 Tax=Panicum virgatum TaxID=38727 RepID=A0A8T0NLH3_PANVG|nr:hypothetical protein PVAP13_9KG207439 [Panicum virgatum]
MGKKKRAATSHARRNTHRCRSSNRQQVQQLAPTTPAESSRSRRRRGLPMMPDLPIDLAQIFLLCTSQIHARRHLLPPAAAPSAAGAWRRACLLHRAAAWPR